MRQSSYGGACYAEGAWRGISLAGIVAVVEIVCGIVLGFGGVPFDHSFPLGSIYIVLCTFWKMSSANSLKMDHAQMKFRLMQEENMAKGNRQ